MATILNNGPTIRTLLEAMDEHIKANLTSAQARPLESMLHTILVLWDADAGSPAAKAPGGHQVAKMNMDRYDERWSYVKKFIYFLRTEKRFLHLREVGDLIADAEGLGPEEAAKLPAKISAAIGGLKKKSLAKYQVGTQNRNTFWGKKEWLEAPNKPKEQYKGNDKYLNTHHDDQDSLDF